MPTPYILQVDRQFEHDLKLAKKRGKQLGKLEAIVEQLRYGQTLAAKHRVHKLKGNYYPFWECHIEPDWLLIYNVIDGEILHLIRTGTHSDLFS